MYEDTPLVMVEDLATLKKVAKKLARAQAIGVDTESDSFYSYKEKVCLIQVSDTQTDYIIDPLAVGDLSVLAPIMASEDTIKIFHGADYDVVCLKRDYDYEFRNLFDTMVASQLLALPRVGLADLIDEYFGITIDKKYQRHDWSRRPLQPEHIEYARGDSHFLPALREILVRQLKRRGRLAHVKEECKLLEKREWEGRTFDPDGYLDVKTSSKLDATGKRVLRRLYLYREAEAEKMDRPVFKVIGDKDLVRIAEIRPTSRKDLDKAMPGKAGLKRRHASALVEAVREGLDDDFPIPKRKPKPKPKRKGKSRLRGRAQDRAFNALKTWRNDMVKSDPHLTPVAAVSNSVLKEIARRRPMDLKELRKVEDVRKWQVKDFGEQILGVLDRVAPLD